MATPRLRCFVAMPIGRDDTDRVYASHIEPVLRRSNILPVFMGILEHNDDIDKRIIQEIEKCDFAIADLTYARPSVYFEAGYAQRKVPVIYTCRRDHLKPKPKDKDPYENFKVHFDLQMRNIVRWSSPTDGPFSARLKKRITFVTRPLLRDRTAEILRAREEAEFRRLPVLSRLALVKETFRKRLERDGYRPIVRPTWRSPWWAGRVRPKPSTLGLISLLVQDKFTEKRIRESVKYAISIVDSRLDDADEYQWSLKWGGYKKRVLREQTGITRLETRFVLCSLEKVPPQRVAAALPSYAASLDHAVYERMLIPGTEMFERILLPHHISVFRVDDIRSGRAALGKARSLSLALKRSFGDQVIAGRPDHR